MEILQDIATKIGFDWRLALTHLINFLIIFFLLVKFALPGVKKTIEERRKKIAEGLKMREDADKIVENAKREGTEIVRGANFKAEEIVTKADTAGTQIVADANVKAGEIVQGAMKEQASAKEKGLKDAENSLSKDLPKILAKIASNSFDAKITADVNNDFVAKVFKEKF